MDAPPQIAPLRYLCDDIEGVYHSDLSERRLKDLLHGYSSFDDVLYSRSDPITLEDRGKPYRIIDGRHRIYLAREKGYSTVPAKFI